MTTASLQKEDSFGCPLFLSRPLVVFTGHRRVRETKQKRTARPSSLRGVCSDDDGCSDVVVGLALALGAGAVELHLVVDHDEPVGRGDTLLQLFNLGVHELDDQTT